VGESLPRYFSFFPIVYLLLNLGKILPVKRAGNPLGGCVYFPEVDPGFTGTWDCKS